MNVPNRRKKPQLTPETMKAWTLAVYPAAVLLLVGFLFLTNRPITTEIIGLVVGLLTAGGLQAAIKKNGASSAESSDSDVSSNMFRRPGDSVLESRDRSRPDDPDSWTNRFVGLWRNQVWAIRRSARSVRIQL